ncbi:MAG: hypothetical protein E6Q40_10215 [Cupriavidus sp.]|nr:MAG: hypothetical protein E6Q40_10215 [Cupriavidus sp.]
MTKVFCGPKDLIPKLRAAGVEYFSMYGHDGLGDVCTVGSTLIDDIKAAGMSPSIATWDFLSLALAVSAADHALERKDSPDGWTRTIEMELALYEPGPFRAAAQSIQEALRFLTGDFWQLTFIEGGYPPPRPRSAVIHPADCVALLSGGLDSLVGAIDLKAQRRDPLFVSHVARGDKDKQTQYAALLGREGNHVQWNQNVWLKPQGREGEPSTRARSVVFFAFAAIAADHLATLGRPAPVDVFVPENGLISLNVPLNAGRVGSLSTKTTHPVFMRRLQALWRTLGIPAELRLPYVAKTKGEMLTECADQVTLAAVGGASTSCGRFGHYGLRHCGRCVPCMVRRASFLHAALEDTTAEYVYADLNGAQRDQGADDVAAVATAVLKVEEEGVRAFTAGQFSFAEPAQRREFEGVVERGLKELGVLLRMHHVL